MVRIKAQSNVLCGKTIIVFPEFVERRMWSERYRYAGTIDALAMIRGKVGVLDIKTSQAIYRDYCLQTSAYVDALKGQFRNLQTRWILRIDQIQNCMRCNAVRRMKGGREKIKIMNQPADSEKNFNFDQKSIYLFYSY